MHFLSKSNFTRMGEFAGFIRNIEDKRRMLVRVNDTDTVEMKVPKALRRRFEPQLREGMRIVVTGIEYRDFADHLKLVVSEVRLLSPAPAATNACVRCPIRVCAKKNCWKIGGKELFEALKAKPGEMDVQAVGCLDNCKHGPTIAIGKKIIGRCNPRQLDELIATAVIS